MNPGILRVPGAELANEIALLIKEKLLVEVGSPEEDLLVGGVLDSLTLIQLLMHLEERFKITIPLEDLEIENIRSIRSIVQLVEDRRVSAAGGA
jgi:methoxymalonate biosynthesis acyl carrier protein